MRWLAALCFLVGCSHAPHADGSGDTRALTPSEATVLVAEPCPSGATAKGWRRNGEQWSQAAWCEDAGHLLQGPSATEDRDGTRRGHYRDGIADGAFTGPRGGAVYRHGRLDGTCTSGWSSLSFRDGRLDGPSRWQFGDWCNTLGSGDQVRAADCPHSDDVVRGIVVGTFADGTLRELSITSAGRKRDISVEPGASIELPELRGDPSFTNRFASLIGPTHTWDGWPRCEFANDEAVHRALP